MTERGRPHTGGHTGAGAAESELRWAGRPPGRGSESLRYLLDLDRELADSLEVGVRRTINVGLLDSDGGVDAGDWVLVHVGFALSKVDEEEAHATLALLRRMGADYERELEELKASVIE